MSETHAKSESPILAFVFLAACLRFFLLDKESLWFDEAYSWLIASQTFEHALTSEVNNPPLYYVLLYYWTGYFGASEFALRSLSVLAGVLATAVLYFLARRLFGKSAAFCATLFYCLSSFHIYYAQETRAFCLLSLLLLISVSLLWRMLESGAKLNLQVSYALVLTAALYTHFISIFFIAAQSTYILWRFRLGRNFWKLLAPQVLSVLIFSPWLLQMLNAAGGGGQVRRHLMLKFPQAIFSFLFGDTLIPLDEAAVQNIRQTLLQNWPILALAVLSVAVLGLYWFKVQKAHKTAHIFILTQALLPMLLAFIVSFKIMLFDERYLIFSGLLLLLPLGSVAATTFEDRSKAGRLAVLVYCGLVMLSLGNYFFNPRFGREQWRDVVGTIEASADGDDLVMFDVGYLDIPYKYYKNWDYPMLRAVDNYVAALPDTFPWEAEISHHPTIWLVRAHYENDRVLDVLKSKFDVVGQVTFPKAKRIEVYKLQRKSNVFSDTANL